MARSAFFQEGQRRSTMATVAPSPWLAGDGPSKRNRRVCCTLVCHPEQEVLECEKPPGYAAFGVLCTGHPLGQPHYTLSGVCFESRLTKGYLKYLISFQFTFSSIALRLASGTQKGLRRPRMPRGLDVMVHHVGLLGETQRTRPETAGVVHKSLVLESD